MLDFIGGLIGSGLKLLGGSEAEKSADARAAQNIASQKEFAQHGVSWKVDDARRAGISPLAALGASTTSFSNVVGGEGKFGDAIGDASQDVSRAIQSTSNREQRGLQLAAAKLEIEGKSLDNDIKRAELASQIRKGTSPAVGPPSPVGGNRWLVDGQGDTGLVNTGNGLVKSSPFKQTTPEPGVMHMEPGANPEVGFARGSNNAYTPIPGQQIKEQIEDSPAEYVWFARNYILPLLGLNESPPNIPPPSGYRWGMGPDFAYHLYPVGPQKFGDMFGPGMDFASFKRRIKALSGYLPRTRD